MNAINERALELATRTAFAGMTDAELLARSGFRRADCATFGAIPCHLASHINN